MSIQAAIFDLDGTVLDTAEDLGRSLNYALEKTGHRHDYSKKEVEVFFGSGIRVAILRALSKEKGMSDEDLLTIGTEEEVLPEGVSRELTPPIQGLFAPHYVAHCMEHTGPYEGILPMLHALKEKGIRTAVVSNKLDAAVKELTEECFAGAFDVAMGERPDVKRKPAPDMIRMAMKEMQVDRAVYVGDSEVDLLTAGNAGLPCIMVTWGFRSKEYLQKNGAGNLVSDPQELTDAILALA